jgi:FdhE protein
MTSNNGVRIGNEPDYDARINRAKQLASEYPFAAEVLGFYQRLAAFQKTIYSEMSKASEIPSDASKGDLRAFAVDNTFSAKHFPRVLAFLQETGPAPIAAAASQMASEEVSAWAAYLAHFLRDGQVQLEQEQEQEQETLQQSTETLKEFLLRAFLQPQIEFLVQALGAPPAHGRPRNCPRCDSVPLLGVLRPEGEGAKRFLVCSFCLGEWEFRRILCPACGEEAEQKLPVYVAEQLPHIRIEACDTCKSYLRTIDLTKNGRAVPIVDDLAAIPLSFWAEEHGYTRLHPNLLGT